MQNQNLPKKQWTVEDALSKMPSGVWGEVDNLDNDDRQIGRILSRREVLMLLGAAGVTLLAGCEPAQSGSPTPISAAPTGTLTPLPPAEAAATLAPTEAPATAAPACVVRPEVTEGPYYVDENLNRSDIRADTNSGVVKEGIPLVLTFNVSQITDSSCSALEGAKVEIWHCDAAGVYSDVSDPGFNTIGQNFLRGYQLTDANGVAQFTTIYPGWYSGRTIHIHFKVHDPTSDQNKVFTSQLFFDDALSDQVFSQAPYAEKGQRDRLNSTDSIYQDLLLLAATQTDQGYAATFDIGLDLSTLGTGSSGGGAPGGSERPPGGGSPQQSGG
jgi:protocatechuate 3,4-dioxygenase beta subunit